MFGCITYLHIVLCCICRQRENDRRDNDWRSGKTDMYTVTDRKGL